MYSKRKGPQNKMESKNILQVDHSTCISRVRLSHAQVDPSS